MNKRTQRNKFYLDLLKITERGEGSSLNKQAFRTDFEDAMRLGTKEKISAKNKNKKETAAELIAKYKKKE